MSWRRKSPDPTQQLLSLVQILTAKVDQMALDFTALDADISSLKQEVAQAISLIQANASNAASAAADAAALAQRDADIKMLCDQLAAALAPAPAASPSS